MINTQDGLIDRKQLIERYPALGAKRYRLDWLIRSRQLPFFKKNRSIFFNPKKIDEWIRNYEIDIED